MSYYRKVYLRSTDWQNLRAAVIADRCPDRRCEFCGCRPNSLDVHHFNYRNLFDVLPEDLGVACRSCHSKVHTILTAHPEWKNIHSRERQRLVIKDFHKDQLALEYLWRRTYKKVRLWTKRLSSNSKAERRLFRYLILYFKVGFALDESRANN